MLWYVVVCGGMWYVVWGMGYGLMSDGGYDKEMQWYKTL